MKFHPFNLKKRIVAYKYRKGEFSTVIDDCEKLLRKNPNDVVILELKARAHTSLRNWEEGRRAFEKVVSLDPNFLGACIQLARCAVYTKKWDVLSKVADIDPAILENKQIQVALNKKLHSLPPQEFLDFARYQNFSYAVPKTSLNRWVNLSFDQRPPEILQIDRHCLDELIGGANLGFMIRMLFEESTSIARITLDLFVQKYPISMVSQWMSPGLRIHSESAQIITDWLISYVNPKEISLQTLDALCVTEKIPPHIEAIVSEYLSHCSPQEVKQAIRVIGRKSDPRNYVSDEVIKQMLSEGIDVSDSDPTVHTWMIEHMLRTQELDSLKNIFSNQTRGILTPVLKTLENLLVQENEKRLLELIRLIVETRFMLTNVKLRHVLNKILLKIAEPEIAHSFAMESILLQPQDAVSGLIAMKSAIKTGNQDSILATGDVVLNMRSRSSHVDYAAIAIAAIRKGNLEFAEELLKENRLKAGLLAHRIRIGLQFFERKNYVSTLAELGKTPEKFSSDNSIKLYKFFSFLNSSDYEGAEKALAEISHPSELAFSSYLFYQKKGDLEQAKDSLGVMAKQLGVREFPSEWLNKSLEFNALPKNVLRNNTNDLNSEFVSIIMTTHKWNKFLPTALSSILSQTHANFELIIVDDHSPEEDLVLYDEIMVDKRIRRIRMDRNYGTYHCRNAGLEIAKGDFITFADSDDWIHPDKLEYSINCIKENKVDLIINRFVRISENGKIWFNGNKLTQFSLVGMFISGEKVRELNLKFDGRARFGADSEFLERVTVVLGPSKIKRTNFVELLALHHHDSLTGGGENSIDWTGPGETRQRYADGYRRNIDLIAAGKQDSSVLNFSPPGPMSNSFRTSTHGAIREIFGATIVNMSEHLNKQVKESQQEPIHVFMATYPGGFKNVGRTVKNLTNQSIDFSNMTIHVNGSQSPPGIPNDPRIKIINSTTDLADNGKFAYLDNIHGYVVTVDDDIDYPFDYLEKLINGVNLTNKKAIVGLHGAVLPVGPPVTRWSHYKEFRRTHVFNQQQSSYNPVNVIGTGTMAFHSTLGIPNVGSMNTLRMVDLHIAVWAQKNNIPMYILPRAKNWIKEFDDVGEGRIWQNANVDSNLQSDMIQTLSKTNYWVCDSIRSCKLEKGPLSAHRDWSSRELPPLMELKPIRKWPDLNHNPKVTIYIPAYNVEKYIQQCVESALNQTYPNFEISIHDDGSSDDTWNILKSRYGNHSKVILNSQPNKGIGFATNSAISNGNGELILQLDSDDMIERNTLSTLVDAIKGGYVCAYGNFRRIMPNGSLIDEGWEVPIFSRSRLMKDMIVHPPRLFRRDVWEFIGKHNEKLVNAEDFDLFLRMSEVGSMIHVRETLYSYRILETSSTRSKSDIMTINTHDVINSALERQNCDKFELTIGNPKFPRRVSFSHVSFSEL